MFNNNSQKVGIGVAHGVAVGIGHRSDPASIIPLVGGRAQTIHHGMQPIVLVIGEMNRGTILVTHRVHLAGGGVGIGCGIPVAVGTAVDGSVVIIGITGDPAKGIGFLGDRPRFFRYYIFPKSNNNSHS